jgi:hypothetical protein
MPVMVSRCPTHWCTLLRESSVDIGIDDIGIDDGDEFASNERRIQARTLRHGKPPLTSRQTANMERTIGGDSLRTWQCEPLA